MDTRSGDEEPNDAPIRGEIRQVGFRRVSHGLFLPLRAGLDEDQEFRRDLMAWLLVLPGEAVFTHVTAARLLGWQLPALPDEVPVFAAVVVNESRPRRPGLICSRLVRPHEPGHVGLPVDRPEEILLRASRDLGVLDLVIMIDSARKLGHIDNARMAAVLASGRPGVRVLRVAWNLSSDRPESGPETVLRMFHVAMDVDVEPQAVLTDADGQVIGRADLLVTGTRRIHEYDGAGHRDGNQHRIDLRRERGLAGSEYERRGFTLDDLLNHDLVVMHEIDRELGRSHKLARLTRWRRLVENSLYSEVGRERVLNRWHRLMGVTDWSRTA